MYHRMVEKLTEGTQYLRAGATLLVGWTQGEADANVEAYADAYEANQGAFFDAVVSLADTLSLGAPSFYDTQLHDLWGSAPVSRPHWAEVRAAKLAVESARSDVTVLLQPASIAIQSGDEIHLTGEAQAVMGEAEVAAAGF